MSPFSPQDLQQMQAKGIQPGAIESQLRYFREGFPYLPVERAATPGDGILNFSREEALDMASRFQHRKKGKKLLKFVPASGAASRMFKDLFSFLSEDVKSPYVLEFLQNLDKFAFAEPLQEILSRTGQLSGNEKAIVRSLILPEGLGYGFLPKALLAMHRYPGETRTALEEHLTEGALYAAETEGTVRLHFTVSPEHRVAFEKKISSVLPEYEQRHGKQFEISLSTQEPCTDTLAVDENNHPFRNDDGSLLFRPGGHGALLENLNRLDADLVFIKNIDNVVPDHLKPETVLYKAMLAQILLDLQQASFDLLTRLEESPDKETLREAAYFLSRKLCCSLPERFDQEPLSNQKNFLREKLNRPIRVCGMVKNEGEPGGGPFWVKMKDGSCSLQIAESSQIDPDKQSLIACSTHFNPVDLVCGIKDYRGNRFDLMNFRDQETGFISLKSKDGKALKAQELPGLWNGSMAFWNTVFAEVPILTFNPVKTVNDLLRPEHQASSPTL